MRQENKIVITNKKYNIIKKICLFFAATAIISFASCSVNSYVGDQEENTGRGGAISFSYEMPAATRTEATEAAKLSNQFIVWGEKGEVASGAAYTDDDATGNAHQLVFPNYVVNFSANTAYTTTSNTRNWEYVGFKFDDNTATPSTEYYSTYITPNSKPVPPSTDPAPNQTIKYWDNNATSYTFTAVSAKPADITAGRVSIAKTTSGADVYKKGYVVTLAKDASDNYPDISYLYFADRVNIAKGAGYTYAPVTFNFRNSLSHVRVGMYETIPGYEVTAITFKVTGDNDAKNSSNADAFGAICPNVSATTFTGEITVTYYDNTDADTKNHPKIELTTTTGSSNDLILGTNINGISAASPLATTAASPTYDTSGANNYTPVLPQISNSTPLQLKVDYTLRNSVTGETINITGKTAKVPAQYLQWKPNFKYTYLFKITDDNLSPITFDAVEIVTEDGKAEYITTVTEPSITTFGVALDEHNKFKNYITEKNDYQLPSGTDKLDIYATFMQGANVLTPQLTSNNKANFVTVYAVKYKDGATPAEMAEKPITELNVANAIENTGGLITATSILTADNEYFSTSPTAVTTVPGEDGTNKTIAALKLQGVKAAGKYAVEIVTYDTGTVLASSTPLDGYYYYTSSDNTYSAASGTADGSTTYYKQIKTYKVITVEAAPVTP